MADNKFLYYTTVLLQAGDTMKQNTIANAITAHDYGRMTATLVSAYVRNNHVPASDLAELIASAADALIGLGTPNVSTASTAGKITQAEIRRSITHEALISFEDGKRYKTLKRHLTTCGLTPETYRAKWGLPSNYPMVAPGYSQRRSAIAARFQFNRGYRAPPAQASQDSRAPAAAFSIIGTTEQVPERLAPKQRSPAPPAMLRPIVDHMAALAEGSEVGTDVVRGVMIPVGRGEDDAGATSFAENIGP